MGNQESDQIKGTTLDTLGFLLTGIPIENTVYCNLWRMSSSGRSNYRPHIDIFVPIPHVQREETVLRATKHVHVQATVV